MSTLIFPWLDGKGLCQASRVSKKWKLLAENESLWKNLCKRQWNAERSLSDSWKSRFKLGYLLENKISTTKYYEMKHPYEISLPQFFLQLKVKPRDHVIDFRFNLKEFKLEIDLLGTAEPVSLPLDPSADPTTVALNAEYIAIEDKDKKIHLFERKTKKYFKEIPLPPDPIQSPIPSLRSQGCLFFKEHLLVYFSKTRVIFWDIRKDSEEMLLGLFPSSFFHNVNGWDIRQVYPLNDRWIFVELSWTDSKLFLLDLSSKTIRSDLFKSSFLDSWPIGAIAFDDTRLALMSKNGIISFWNYDDAHIQHTENLLNFCNPDPSVPYKEVKMAFFNDYLFITAMRAHKQKTCQMIRIMNIKNRKFIDLSASKCDFIHQNILFEQDKLILWTEKICEIKEKIHIEVYDFYGDPPCFRYN